MNKASKTKLDNDANIPAMRTLSFEHSCRENFNKIKVLLPVVGFSSNFFHFFHIKTMKKNISTRINLKGQNKISNPWYVQ